MNFIPGRLIEPAFSSQRFRLRAVGGKGSFASAGTAGRRKGANLQVASRALAPFALRGPPETVPQIAGGTNLERRAAPKAPGK